MTEEIRPICLYVETCLDKKEGTRDCAKCEHHLNYWTEVMIRDMEKNIKRLEQENKGLLEARNHFMGVNLKYFNALEEIKGTVQKGMYSLRKGYGREYQDTLSNIFNKINEVLNG